MSKLPTIAVIGPGVMGEAIIAGLLRDGLTQASLIHASTPEKDRVDDLEGRFRIQPFTDNNAAVQGADVVILAVKPQVLPRVLVGLRDQVQPNALVLSIVAGASITDICTGLNHPSVVRVMPNTPAQIGEGIAVWTDSDNVTPEQRDLARQILGALGKEIYVDEESYLDMATALSGSGPAYVFMFMEAMIDAGVHLGFSRRIAETLVVETMRGSVDYYSRRLAHPAALRNEVTSPGGTSAAALYYLEKAGFRTAISRAIWAAYERSQELGKGKNSHSPEKQDRE